MKKCLFCILLFLLFSCSTRVTEFRKSKDSDDVFYSDTSNFTLTMDSPKSYAEDENNYFAGNIYFKISISSYEEDVYFEYIDLKVYDENHNIIKIENFNISNKGIVVAKNVDINNMKKGTEYDSVYIVCENKIYNSSIIYISYKIKILFNDESFEYWDENVELKKYILNVDKHFLI